MARYAAVDIGSNSVRMFAAELATSGAREVLANHREVTRLGESVFRDGRISAGALDELCGILARFRQSIAALGISNLRAVATSAVRDSANQIEFLERASEALGARVEIISGIEEARLIHLGVLSLEPLSDERLLIVDVGGGSAEIIFSEGGLRWEGFSKPLGAVRLTEVFLKHDPPASAELERMGDYIEEKVAPCVEANARRRFRRAAGTSSTAAAMACAIHGIARDRREQAAGRPMAIRQLRRLYQDLRGRDVESRRKMTGIGPRRAEIIVAGVAVFLRVLEALKAPQIQYSTAGVKDGIIADLAAREQGRNVACLGPEQRLVVEQMAQKFGVSVPHARKVAEVALRLFEKLLPLHGLPAHTGRLLEAAAYLHDVGHYISDSAHHKHSAYVVANSGMPGFTDRERQAIAMLCRFHRKSMPAARHDAFHALSEEDRRTVRLLLPLLRLADSLDRSHRQTIGEVDCRLDDGRVRIEVASAAGTDLDVWAAERVADVFAEVYGRALELGTMRS